jgi:hypothetical protein
MGLQSNKYDILCYYIYDTTQYESSSKWTSLVTFVEILNNINRVVASACYYLTLLSTMTSLRGIYGEWYVGPTSYRPVAMIQNFKVTLENVGVPYVPCLPNFFRPYFIHMILQIEN